MAFIKSWFVIDYKLESLSGFDDPHVRFPSALPAKFIKEYTNKGDNVFDPFSGFGTTLTTAQKLGRNDYGIEFDEKKIPYIQARLKAPSKVIHGSALDIGSFDLPLMDLSFTSPPYMRTFDTENPLSNYAEEGSRSALRS